MTNVSNSSTSNTAGSPADPTTAPARPAKVRKTDDQWRAELDPMEYAVLREAATERPFTGEYTDTKTQGVYYCRACGATLFTSAEKFDSHCGWPSFYAPTEDDNVTLIEDRSFGSVRTEVRCATCDSHLGHVFAGEGYATPTDQRWCINSVALRLEPVTPESAGPDSPTA
ncbi:peptide-methionine (R)-S-oxide reductase [Nakamurella silvestris]|nr:peptide-methionine (R)-S-oxide reductase [Nakamurella silvestris]